MKHDNQESFDNHRLLILSDLNRLSDSNGRILAELCSIRESIVALKVKAAVVGGLAGILVNILAAWFMKKM